MKTITHLTTASVFALIICASPAIAQDKSKFINTSSMSQDEICKAGKGKTKDQLIELFGKPDRLSDDFFVYVNMGKDKYTERRYSACRFLFVNLIFNKDKVSSCSCAS